MDLFICFFHYFFVLYVLEFSESSVFYSEDISITDKFEDTLEVLVGVSSGMNFFFDGMDYGQVRV
jgi:hypothetical protein